jgi:hypothetical protein
VITRWLAGDPHDVVHRGRVHLILNRLVVGVGFEGSLGAAEILDPLAVRVGPESFVRCLVVVVDEVDDVREVRLSAQNLMVVG